MVINIANICMYLFRLYMKVFYKELKLISYTVIKDVYIYQTLSSLWISSLTELPWSLLWNSSSSSSSPSSIHVSSSQSSSSSSLSNVSYSVNINYDMKLSTSINILITMKSILLNNKRYIQKTIHNKTMNHSPTLHSLTALSLKSLSIFITYFNSFSNTCFKHCIYLDM